MSYWWKNSRARNLRIKTVNNSMKCPKITQLCQKSSQAIMERNCRQWVDQHFPLTIPITLKLMEPFMASVGNERISFVCVGGGCFGREGQSSLVQTNHNPSFGIYCADIFAFSVVFPVAMGLFFSLHGWRLSLAFSPRNSSIELINWLALPKCSVNIYLLKAYPRKQFSYGAQMRNFPEWQKIQDKNIHGNIKNIHMNPAIVQAWTFLNQF